MISIAPAQTVGWEYNNLTKQTKENMKNLNHFEVITNNSYAYNVSDKVNNYITVANTAQTVTVPTGATVAVFSPSVVFYADFTGGTAVVPSVNVTDGTGMCYSPISRYISGISTFSIISPSVGVITIEFYSL